MNTAPMKTEPAPRAEKPFTPKKAWRESKKLARDLRAMTAPERLAEIRACIDRVADRCLAVDGPVGKEIDEITEPELRAIYLLTTPI